MGECSFHPEELLMVAPFAPNHDNRHILYTCPECSSALSWVYPKFETIKPSGQACSGHVIAVAKAYGLARELLRREYDELNRQRRQFTQQKKQLKESMKRGWW